MEQKTTKDYIDQLMVEFPTLPRAVINKICLYGSRKLYVEVQKGYEFMIREKGHTFMMKIFREDFNLERYKKNALYRKRMVVGRRNARLKRIKDGVPKIKKSKLLRDEKVS